jgi:hypothetical protein
MICQENVKRMGGRNEFESRVFEQFKVHKLFKIHMSIVRSPI